MKRSVTRGLIFWPNYVFQKNGSTLAYVKREDPDVFCVQETKCQEETLPKVLNCNNALQLSLAYDMYMYVNVECLYMYM